MYLKCIQFITQFIQHKKLVILCQIEIVIYHTLIKILYTKISSILNSMEQIIYDNQYYVFINKLYQCIKQIQSIYTELKLQQDDVINTNKETITFI